MRVGVCACGCVGGDDIVYGRGCEGGQDEDSDYICASYIAYIECVSYCLFFSSFL